MHKGLRLAALLVFLAGAALEAGQQPAAPPPAPPPPQGPTFKVRVDYVEVDVVVTDRQGNLVRDLKKEDFQVLEDGKTQAINTFTQVDIPVERADRPLFAALPIEPDVKTNEKPFDGRVYVMVIDDLHTRFGRSTRVKAAAKQFIERRLGANDLMAVVHTAGSTDANQEFTSNKRLLLAAVDKTNGRKLDAATRSNVAIYGIDPRGLTDLGDESIEIQSYPDDTSLGVGPGSLFNEVRLAQDSLRVLSDETGGFAVVNKNDFSTAYQRIVEDNSTYYVLAYYPPDARPGRLHKIDVRVTRPGLSVRARKGYVTPKKIEEAKTANAKSPSTPELREALDSPLPVSGLTIHVFAAPFKGAAPNASVLFGVEMRGSDLKLAQNAKFLLSYIAIDQNGKLRGGNTDSLAMPNLKPET